MSVYLADGMDIILCYSNRSCILLEFNLRWIVNVDPLGAQQGMADRAIPVHYIHQDTTLCSERR